MPATPHIGVPAGMTESPLHHDHPPRAGIFSCARERLTIDAPARLVDPHVLPHDQHDADRVIIGAIGTVCPIKLAAAMVPIIECDELTVLSAPAGGD